MGMKLAVGLGLAGFLVTIGWLHTRLATQQAQMAGMETRIVSLEGQLEDALSAPASARPGTVPSAPRPHTAAGATAPQRLSPAQLAVDDALRARILAAPARDGDRPSESVRVVRAAILDVLATEDPELREGFRSLVREQQAELRDERRERRQTRWEEHASERIAQFGDAQGLTQHQQDALFTLLTAARDGMSEAFRAGRESEQPTSRAQLREQVQSVQEQADEEARELLDDAQFEAYQAMREEQGLLGRGGRRQNQGPPKP